MNIHDDINTLARDLGSCPEFLRYKEAALKVDSNPSHASMIKEFLSAQAQITAAKMMGRDPSSEVIDSFNMLYSTISNISAISEFLLAQSQFMQIFTDLNSAVNRAVKIDVDFLRDLTGMDGSIDEEYD